MNDPIIDAHHHIWRVARAPSLSGPQLPRIFGDYNALRRDYPVGELIEWPARGQTSNSN